jgi:hypothetical protein
VGLLQYGFMIFIFLLAWSVPSLAARHPREPLPEYRLQISFDLPKRKALGRAIILAPPGHKLTIDAGKIDIREIRHRGEKIATGRQPGKDIVLYAQGPIQVDYEVSLKKTGDNAIDQRDIILQSGWYPLVEGFCLFKLTATLPSGYLAISEADQVTHTEKDGQAEFVFDFPYPLHDQDGLTLAASNRWVVSRESQNNIELLTYLFPEEARTWHPVTWRGPGRPWPNMKDSWAPIPTGGWPLWRTPLRWVRLSPPISLSGTEGLSPG